jgi:cytochrome c oxidase assembly protein subunit 15
LLLAWRLLRIPGLAVAGVGLLAAVSLQFLLGVANVAFSLPLPVAVGHNAGAALLLLVLVWINAALARSRP